jgi:hypothetical protein
LLTIVFLFLFLSINADFVSWRGLLTKLLCTPYENREGWKVAVSYFDKTWYLCEFEADQAAADDFKNSDRQKEMTYWGFKFETYITSGITIVVHCLDAGGNVRLPVQFIYFGRYYILLWQPCFHVTEA